LIGLLHRRVRKLGPLVAKVLGERTPEAVHDLRVLTRRVQQTLTALFAGSRYHRLRLINRTLRRSRRALGEWRNYDVVLERLARKRRQTRSAEKQRAWALVIDSVRQHRQHEMRRARRRLVRLDLFDLNDEVEALLEAHSGISGGGAGATPREIVAAARASWQTALSRAFEERRPENVHAFRIETKRLRYRIELVRDLGVQDTAEPLKWLASLQEALGGWHDRLELGRCIAQAVAASETLYDQPRLSMILLAELEKEQKLAAAEVDALMREVSKSPRRKQFDAWAAHHEQASPPATPQAPEPVAAAEPIPAEQPVPTE
jgi:CHAD domain-containing protein